MPRNSYFQRIARTDASVPALRPRPALFRRWELAQLPVTQNAFPAEKDSIRQLRVEEPSRATVPAAKPLASPRRLTKKTSGSESQPTSSEQQPGRSSTRLSDDKPPTVKVKGAHLPRIENVGRARPSIKVPQAAPRPPATETRKPITKEVKRIAASSARRMVPIDLENAHREKTEAPIVEDKVVPVFPNRAATRPIETRPASSSDSESGEEKHSPARFRPSGKQHLPPTVKIGTIDIQVTPPPMPAPPSNPRRSSKRHAAPVLSRGFTSLFGLRQG